MQPCAYVTCRPRTPAEAHRSCRRLRDTEGEFEPGEPQRSAVRMSTDYAESCLVSGHDGASQRYADRRLNHQFVHGGTDDRDVRRRRRLGGWVGLSSSSGDDSSPGGRAAPVTETRTWGGPTSHQYRVELPALIGPLQGLGVKGGVEPGGEGPGQSARSEESGGTAGDEVAKRDEPDEPAMHLCGVGLQRQVDGKTLVVFADGDPRALDVEPPLGAAGSGEHDMHNGAGFGQLGGDSQLVDTPDQ